MWGWGSRRGTLPEDAANPWEKTPAPGRDIPRDRVLTDEEIGLVWNAAGTLASPYGPMIRFLTLTLARREEATAAAWGEIAPDLSSWTQPASRTKNAKAHVVHLSEPVRAILRALLTGEDGQSLPRPVAGALIFGTAADKPITTHSWVKRQIDKAVAQARAKADRPPVPHWVLHDLRRTGPTWLAGAGFPPHVADRLLNHVEGTIRGVARVYQKTEFIEERRRALDAWAAHVLACAEGGMLPDNILDFRGARLERAR
jgi:integrase